jgi:3-oxoisoapionate decarboxylase
MLSVLGVGIGALARCSLVGASAPLRSARLGIGMHSYGVHWRAAKEGRDVKFHDAATFLDYAHELGAGGVQVAIGDNDLAYARALRTKAERYEMYFEAQFQLPKNDADLPRFERNVRLAREAGATVFRAACLSGRRYETFKSTEEFREFQRNSRRSIALAEPVLKKARLRVAIENHKDWLVPELLEILRRTSSEWVGVCVDTGNSIALMEDAMEVIEGLAPHAFSVHLKDMGFGACADGFLLSEDGFLPLAKIIGLLRKGNPAVRFNLEMITRDPLRVPCLSAGYWATMPNAPAVRLAQALATAKRYDSKRPLPRTTGLEPAQQLKIEDEHVRASMAFARSQPGL